MRSWLACQRCHYKCVHAGACLLRRPAWARSNNATPTHPSRKHGGWALCGPGSRGGSPSGPSPPPRLQAAPLGAPSTSAVRLMVCVAQRSLPGLHRRRGRHMPAGPPRCPCPPPGLQTAPRVACVTSKANRAARGGGHSKVGRGGDTPGRGGDAPLPLQRGAFDLSAPPLPLCRRGDGSAGRHPGGSKGKWVSAAGHTARPVLSMRKGGAGRPVRGSQHEGRHPPRPRRLRDRTTRHCLCSTARRGLPSCLSWPFRCLHGMNQVIVAYHL